MEEMKMCPFTKKNCRVDCALFNEETDKCAICSVAELSSTLYDISVSLDDIDLLLHDNF